MSNNTGKWSRLMDGAWQTTSHMKDESVDRLSAQVEKLRDKRFCLAVTGLSQSGKSTFITSLINQLMNYDKASLPGFSAVLNQCLLGVKIHRLADKSLAEFPYEEAYRGLTLAPPQWPDSTCGISGFALELRLQKPKSKINPFSRDQYSLFLEIRDYPGEWLLDLPLRQMSYSRWCGQCIAQYTQAPRMALLGPLLADLQELDPLATADEPYLRELNQRFIQFLKDCKYQQHPLSLIQPGRFLIPGDIEDDSILCFIPLLKCGSYTEGQLAAANEESYFKVCERRYQAYIKTLVEPFYKDFFSRIDRQLVLVDVVNALSAGPEYVDDMRQALTNITDSFAYGSQNRLLQLFNPKIDKVVFAATKIDQVVSQDHEAVRQLLALIVKQAYQNAQHQGIQPSCEATAAVRCSHEVKHDGEQGIFGHTEDGDSIGYIHPTIPARLPEGQEWQPFTEWRLPMLKPPSGLSYQNSDVLPHIRLDTVLQSLIGDKCI